VLINANPASAAIFYGATDSGDIYKINTDTQEKTLLCNVLGLTYELASAPRVVVGDQSPNGCGYDAANHRLYFASYNDNGCPANPIGPGNLYYINVDGSSPVIHWIGQIEGYTSDGVFWNGFYWYITAGTNDLHMVNVNNSDESFVCTINHGKPGYLIFGDIDFDHSGVLYLTGAVKNDDTGYTKKYLSGIIDIGTGNFTEIGNGLYWGQIAFGADGLLYGHSSGNFFTINTVSGWTSTVMSGCPALTDIAGDLKQSVSVDIHPTSCPNPLNVGNNGMLTAAILGTSEFNVYMLDPASIRLAGVAPVRSNFEDVAAPVQDPDENNECKCTTAGPDGYTDLTLKFKNKEIVDALADAGFNIENGNILALILTGSYADGTPIEGSDCVVVVSTKDNVTGADSKNK
jgi:hypothetical protein